MKLRVQSSVGVATPTEIEAQPNDRIDQIVEQVAQIQAIDPKSISLVHDGDVLPLDKTLKKCGVKDGATLKAMPRDPVGGAWNGASTTTLPAITRQRILVERDRIHDAGIPLKAASPRRWIGTLSGRGRWRSQTLHLEVTLPAHYPARPPRVRFLTQPNPPHPNIGPSGDVCLNLLQKDWSPTQNLVTVYESLQWLLENPNYGHPLHPRLMHATPLRRWVAQRIGR